MVFNVVFNEDMEKLDVDKGFDEVWCKMIFKIIRVELL